MLAALATPDTSIAPEGCTDSAWPQYVTIPDDAIGATIIFEDDCVPGYRPRQNRVGVIEAIRNSRRDGRYFTVVVPGCNLPKTIRENQIVAHCHPSITA